MNYYTQILHEWKWKEISEAMDIMAEKFRHRPEYIISDEGLDEKINGISLWAGIPEAGIDPFFEVRLYIGSSLNIIPSGKFYMPWSSNVTEKEAAKDEAFMEAFEKVCNKFDMFQQSGEGDALDWYLCRSYVDD